jgi:hypothetical protein
LRASCCAPHSSARRTRSAGKRDWAKAVSYLGWSTYSEQTIAPSSTVMNQQSILAQSDAMRASGLQAHGFKYINLDAGWSGNCDQ